MAYRLIPVHARGMIADTFGHAHAYYDSSQSEFVFYGPGSRYELARLHPAVGQPKFVNNAQVASESHKRQHSLTPSDGVVEKRARTANNVSASTGTHHRKGKTSAATSRTAKGSRGKKTTSNAMQNGPAQASVASTGIPNAAVNNTGHAANQPTGSQGGQASGSILSDIPVNITHVRPNEGRKVAKPSITDDIKIIELLRDNPTMSSTELYHRANLLTARRARSSKWIMDRYRYYGNLSTKSRLKNIVRESPRWAIIDTGASVFT